MCEITLTAQKAGCKTVGGVTKLYFIDKQARVAAGVTYAVATGAVTIAGTGGNAYEIVPRENNVTITQPITDDNTQGTSFVTQTIEMNLHGYTASQVALIDEVRKGRLEILAEFDNGIYALYGIDTNGLQSNGGDAGFTGTAKGDALGQTYTFACESQDTAPIADFTEFQAAFTITTAA